MYETDKVRSKFRELKSTLNVQNISAIFDEKSQKKLRKYFHSLLKYEEIGFRDIFLYKKENILEDERLLLDYKDASIELVRLFVLYVKEDEAQRDENLALGTFYIAGVKYTDDMATVFSHLHVDDILIVAPEGNNPYDTKAIKISTKDGKKLGYLPKRLNHFPSYMLDNRISLKARIVNLHWSVEGYSIKLMLSIQS